MSKGFDPEILLVVWLNMVRKKLGKKGKMGKSTGVEDSSVHQDTAGGNENLQDGGAPPTSSSSNDNLEYEATFSLLDSKGETKKLRDNLDLNQINLINTFHSGDSSIE